MTELTEPKAVPAVASTMARDALVIAAAVPILVKLIGARDLTAILQWLQSSEGATFLAVVLPLVVSGWRAWLSLRTKRALLASPPPVTQGVEP